MDHRHRGRLAALHILKSGRSGGRPEGDVPLHRQLADDSDCEMVSDGELFWQSVDSARVNRASWPLRTFVIEPQPNPHSQVKNGPKPSPNFQRRKE